MDKKIIVFSADAMVCEDLKLLETLPNYNRFLKNSSRTLGMRSVYPSVTYPAHVSMMTGCYPDRTGIAHNCYDNYDIFENHHPIPWLLDYNEIKTETIFDYCHKKGISTAVIYWPVTGNCKAIDYLVNERPGQKVDDQLFEDLKNDGASDEIIKICKKYLANTSSVGRYPDGDFAAANIACEIIREYAPDVTFVHTCNLDSTRHASGVFNENVNRAVIEVDEQIGMLCRAMENAGYAGKYDFILCSDHGQLDSMRILNLNALLVDKGYITLDENGYAVDYKANALSCGMSSHIYLKDPNDVKLKLEIKEYIQSLIYDNVYGISEVLTDDEAEEKYHLKGNFQLVVETDGFTAFGDRYAKPYVSNRREFTGLQKGDYRSGWATHGYQPQKGPQPVFVVCGPSFKEGYVGKEGNILDLAPTVARVLGIDYYDCDGEARTDLLKNE